MACIVLFGYLNIYEKLRGVLLRLKMECSEEWSSFMIKVMLLKFYTHFYGHFISGYRAIDEVPYIHINSLWKALILLWILYLQYPYRLEHFGTFYQDSIIMITYSFVITYRLLMQRWYCLLSTNYTNSFKTAQIPMYSIPTIQMAQKRGYVLVLEINGMKTFFYHFYDCIK